MQEEKRFILELKNQGTDEELKSDVLRCAKLVAPDYLSSSKYSEIGKYHSDTIARRFGNRKWSEALKLLGIDIPIIKHTDKDLLDNIANVWIAKGTQPSRRDMDNHPISKVSSGAYLRRYKTWSIALKTFIEYINSNDDIVFNPNSMTTNNIVHHTSREPSDKLKVQVLKRDGNKCKICGVECDEGLHKLHFDHIKPWSKGGETTLDNLRVLCKTCNEALGNSNET